MNINFTFCFFYHKTNIAAIYVHTGTNHIDRIGNHIQITLYDWIRNSNVVFGHITFFCRSNDISNLRILLHRITKFVLTSVINNCTDVSCCKLVFDFFFNFFLCFVFTGRNKGIFS